MILYIQKLWLEKEINMKLVIYSQISICMQQNLAKA